jgi:hypothetical protein
MPRLWRQLHKTWHEDGGIDEINVAGLSGTLADAQTPLAHHTSHENGGSDEISLSGLSGQQIFVPYNGKIADITHADTDKHNLDLETALGETRKIIAVIVFVYRMLGSGMMAFYPNEAAAGVMTNADLYTHFVIIKDGTQRLQYSLTVANDDYDLYCIGYVVEA